MLQSHFATRHEAIWLWRRITSASLPITPYISRQHFWHAIALKHGTGKEVRGENTKDRKRGMEAMRAVRQMGVDRHVKENENFPEISKEHVSFGISCRDSKAQL